jgi:hypothetical protein
MDILCNLCQNLDLECYFDSESPPPKLTLGYYEQICFRAKSCSFCAEIVGLVNDSHNKQVTTKKQHYPCVLSSGLRYFDYLATCGYTGAYIDEMMEKTKSNTMDAPVTQERAIIFDLPSLPLRLYRLYEKSTPVRPQLLRERLVTSPKLDTTLFKHWYHTCQTYHGSDCSQTAWLSPREPEKLRLIDVRISSVVHAPSDCTYAALSYVWGGPQFVVNEAQMRNLPFRLPQPPVLGRTIADAITLCLEMGIDYLWVDALCITQDPPVNDDKSFQLQQMDRVYRSACLTICATSSTSAKEGIPELHARDPFQKTVSFKGKSYAVEGSTLEDDVDFSPWNWRGWTYQERVLSRRLLIITKKQTYWVCQCDTWAESTLSEPVDGSIRHQGISKVKACSPPGRRYSFGQFATVGAAGYDAEDLMFATYDSLVREYTIRSMGDARDGINAIQGILNLVKDDGACRGVTFIHGLPVQSFDLALNWKAMKGSYGSSSMTDSNGLPSWSWASWFHDTGPGAYHDPVDFMDTSNIDGAIAWFTLDQDGTSRLLLSRALGRSDVVCGLPSDSDVLCPPSVPPTHIQQSGFYLHFLSTIAHFSLGRKIPWEEDLRPTSQSLPEPIQPCVRHWATNHTVEILGSTGTCVGQIILSDSDYVRLLHGKLEFVFLAYAAGFDAMADAADFDDMLPSSKHCSVVSCMLVRRDERTGFVKRISVGKVLRSVWEKAELKSEWIVLG